MTRKQILSRAHNAVVTGLRRGVLKRQHCEVCGAGLGRKDPNGYLVDVHAHHDDYSEPLAVRWLCSGCHKQHHVKNGPGKIPDHLFAEQVPA